MARKNVWRQFREFGEYDHLNKEGFPSYDRPLEEQVLSVLMTGSTANLFYTKATTNIEHAHNVLNQADPEFLAKACIYARNGLVELSAKDPKLFRKIAPRICQNPHDWQTLIDIARSGVVRKGCGRAIKTAIIEALRGMSEYHAMKYPQAVRDMIRIARPHERVNPTVIKYIMEGKHEGEQLAVLKKLKECSDDNALYELIIEGRLPYEVVMGSIPRATPAVWEALFHVAPYFNLIRNLRNFAEAGVFNNEDNVEEAIRRIADPEAVRKSRLFPFRFYAAYAMLREVGLSPTAFPLYDALERAMEISLQNVPPIEGRVAIAPDTSYSMTSHLTGDYSAVRCIHLVGVFTAALKACTHYPLILPFNSNVRMELGKEVHLARGIIDTVSVFSNSVGGGTSLSAPVAWLTENGVEVDYFIAFTDNEEWVGTPFRRIWQEYTNKIAPEARRAWQEYTSKVAPEARAYLVTLLPYGDAPTPPADRNVHYIYGWNDNVLKYITAPDPSAQVEAVNNIRLD